MKTNISRVLMFGIIIVLAFLLFKQCSKKPEKITVKETVDIKRIKDSILETIIKPDPEIKYVQKIITKKGKDSIVYRDTPSDSTITANEYPVTLKANNAEAKLKILTTGELLSVTGDIFYDEKTITKEITEYKDRGGLFVYSDVSLTPVFENIEIGGLYQYRNKVFIKAGISYNNQLEKVYIQTGIGIKIK